MGKLRLGEVTHFRRQQDSAGLAPTPAPAALSRWDPPPLPGVCPSFHPTSSRAAPRPGHPRPVARGQGERAGARAGGGSTGEWEGAGVGCGSIQPRDEWEKRAERREGAGRRGEEEAVEDRVGGAGRARLPLLPPAHRPAGPGPGLQPSAPSAAPRPRRGIDN